MAYKAKTAIVTGASSGIGKAVAQALLVEGYYVYGFSRKPYDAGDVKHISVDVTDGQALALACKRVAQESGGIDLLIANAGYGISGTAEYTEAADARQQMDVNFFGFLFSAQAVLPYMRQTGGKIIAVSSVAAEFSIPFQSFYSASKAAVNALALALQTEVKPFGVTVSVVMPGDVATGFTAAREKSLAGQAVYGAVMQRSVARMEKDEQNGMTPAYVAQKIVTVIKKKRPKPIYTVGRQYKLFVLLNKVLPKRLVRYAIAKMYAK
ncbi:MAG: SDR family NAD(P)-dependent oxidoreductase [Christensenellaceae bacterium]|jgi:short-subunit dehydrogenase